MSAQAPAVLDDTIPARYRMLALCTNATRPISVVARALCRYETEPWTSRSEIAAQAQISQPQLLRWVQLADLPRRRRAPLPPSPDSIDAAVAAFDRYGSVLAAADHLGVGPKAVTARLRIAGRNFDEDRSDTISRRLVERWAIEDPDWMSSNDAAAMVGWSRTYICHLAADGKIHGAERRVVRGGTRLMWHIPRAWAEAQARRSEATVNARRPAGSQLGSSSETKEWLPVGPLVAWVAKDGRTPREFSGGEEAVERGIRRMFSGDQAVVALGWADAFLVACEAHLGDVWDDLDAAIVEGREIRTRNASNAAMKHQAALDRVRAELAAEDRAA